MGKDCSDSGGRAQRLGRVNFTCRSCRFHFDADPGRIEDEPARDSHPFRYFAPCPTCGLEVQQAPWEQGLMAAWGKQTGPKTAEGKARVTANLEGHPTREEAVRTRFNAMKTGLFAQTATYYPAKPGKYPHCSGCEYLETICATQVACLKRTELFMRHQIAFETKDPSLLTELRANLHANIQAIIDDIILAIISEGVQLKTPAWYYDKDGGFHLAEYKSTEGEQRFIYEINAHPLLKVLAEFISRNSLSLGDMAMTPKGQDDPEIIKGHLEGKQVAGDHLLDYQERQAKALEGLSALIQRSQERVKRDPVLIEHGEASGG